MTPASDPYRTLGLDPGATSAEIKRAYRRLAKAYHPDSAGERALPRFLAIQAAYERLTSGQPGARSAGGDGGARRAGPQGPATPPPPGRPWSADAERARATRDAFRKRSTRTGARSGSGGAGGGGATGSTTGSGSTSGAAGPSANPPPAGARTGRTRRGRSKATIGSTSYDGTETEPFEPGWSGAGWYGAASGTYWTINPKEYADPRKHGPEYLARARRSPKQAAGRGGPEEPPERAAGPHDEPDGASWERGESASSSADDAPAAAGPARATPGGATWAAGPRPDARAAQAAAGEALTPSSAPARRTTPQPQPAGPINRAAPGPPSPIHAARFGGLQPARITGSWRGRLFLAALAWFPIGLAIFGIHGQVTGCSQFLASCTDPVAWSVWVPQLIVFVLLLASPRLAWIAASGSILLLCLTVPLAAVLTAGSGGRPPSVGTTELLYAAMAVGWLAGVGIALSGRIPLPPWRAARVR